MIDKIDNQQDVLQLFFDDNIERSHVHIIDVRQPDFSPVDIDKVAIPEWLYESASFRCARQRLCQRGCG